MSHLGSIEGCETKALGVDGPYQSPQTYGGGSAARAAARGLVPQATGRQPPDPHAPRYWWPRDNPAPPESDAQTKDATVDSRSRKIVRGPVAPTALKTARTVHRRWNAWQDAQRLQWVSTRANMSTRSCLIPTMRM